MKEEATKKRKRSPDMEGSSESVHDFLKSRPQIAAMEKSAAADKQPSHKKAARTVDGAEAADLLNDDQFQGDLASWQQNESLRDFLDRLPVADPSTAKVGPWLWVRSPQISWSRKKHLEKEDVTAFEEAGQSLLLEFRKRRLKMEGDNPDKSAATITRYMNPYRDQLEESLLQAAVKTHTTCGKWMLFPSSSDLPRYWRIVAEATSEAKLGPCSKVATHDPFDTKDATLICVYTYDFSDLDDVRRVLDELLELGLCTKDSKSIFYKCDAYTYLNITSDNSYKLRASLFSSKEIFGNEARVLQDGPIARLKKRNKSIDSFLSS